MKTKNIEGREFSTYDNAHGRSLTGRLMSVKVTETFKGKTREFSWSRLSTGENVVVLLWCIMPVASAMGHGEGYYRRALKQDRRRVMEFVSAMVEDVKREHQS